jgi:hypothetical protein
MAMQLPFTPTQFFDVFRQYNEAVWPAQLVLLAAGLAVVLLAFHSSERAARVVSGILAFLWLWMGAIYHLLFFRDINAAAVLFGGLFIVQGGLFAWFGLRRSALAFQARGDIRGGVGAALILYALVLYPILGLVAGHRYPAAPTFGLPCPTTILTFGLLLWTQHRVPRSLLVIPTLWAVVGTVGALRLGVPEDFGLLVAGAIAAPMIFLGNRSTRATRAA